MANDYFKFKQFTIFQQHCAMKVTTDACLFGAIIANEYQHSPINTALDIGAGTGLLALMLAQKCGAIIDAIELDEQAAQQAAENVAESRFKNQIKIIHSDIHHFKSPAAYDLIISNPPFFQNSLKSTDTKRNQALHNVTLSPGKLLSTTGNFANAQTGFCTLLSAGSADGFIKQAVNYDWYCNKRILVKQTEKHQPFREVLFLRKQEQETSTTTITIKIEGNYSQDFCSLLKDYYLAF